MLYEVEAITYTKRGEVYKGRLENNFVATEKMVSGTKLTIGNCSLLVVSNDDVNIVKPIVLVCPITRAKRELTGKEAIGKVQYISNGVMYTVHCDEVRPIDKCVLRDRLFCFSASFMFNIDTAINSMFVGHALEMDKVHVAEDAANRSETFMSKVDIEDLEPKDAQEGFNTIGQAIEKKEKEPVIVVKKSKKKPALNPEATIIDISDTKSKLEKMIEQAEQKNEELAENKTEISDEEFLTRYAACNSKADREELAHSLGLSLCQLYNRNHRVQNKIKMSQDEQLNFCIDYERFKSGEITAERLLTRYTLANMAAATRKYNRIMK